MTDFAARLVARALGAGSSIRPRVLPLFAAPDTPEAPAGFLEENAFAAAPHREETVRLPHEAAISALRSDEARLEQPTTEIEVDRQPRRSSAASPKPMPHISPRSEAVAEAHGPSQARTFADDMPAVRQPLPLRQTSPVSGRAATGQTPNMTEPEVLAPTQLSDSAPSFREAPSEPIARISIAAPPARMPPHADTPPDPRDHEEFARSPELPARPRRAPEPKTAAEPSRRPASAPTDEPPSIVVEIGSIEFRAPHATAPAPARVAARPRPSLALADYLARGR